MSVRALRGWGVGELCGATHLETRLALRAAKLVNRHGPYPTSPLGATDDPNGVGSVRTARGAS